MPMRHAVRRGARSVQGVAAVAGALSIEWGICVMRCVHGQSGPALPAVLAAAAVLTALTASPAEARRRAHHGGGGGYNPPYAAMVVDAKTGRVMHAVNEDALRHPASITKVMTLYLLFEQLERGKMDLDTPLTVSANASRMPPSKLGVRPGSTVTVEEAIKALVTKSANDIACAIGENIAGSEAAFAEMMTRKAHALGMTRTHYANASGLPDADQITTARDLTILARAIQERFPRYYRYFQTRSFAFHGRVIGNHNHLVGRVEGVDGIKTGYTNASGFNIVSAVNHNGRSVVAVVLGGQSAQRRDNQVVALLDRTLPKASRTRGTEQLIASASTSRTFDTPPSVVPLPMFAERQDPIAQKIASADNVMADMMQTSAVAPSAVPPGRSRWEVQIAATDSEAAALSMLKSAKASLSSGHAGVAPYTEAVSTGGATLYRARFTGFDTQAEALSACKDLKARSYSCVVMTSNG